MLEKAGERMMDSDLILDILGNETRRKILAILAQQPMYFNQLAKEMDVGQQAILRHLQALEGGGLVETYAEKSDLGAPDRKYYRLNGSFVLTVALSADDFTITNQKVARSRSKDLVKKYYRRLESASPSEPDTAQALSMLRDDLAEIEEKMADLESRLGDLRALRQLVMRRLHEIGQASFEEDERKVLYKIVEESPKSVAQLSGMTGEKESDLKAVMARMKGKMDRDGARLLFRELG